MRSKKIFVAGQLFDLNDMTAIDIEKMAQANINALLGGSNRAIVSVASLSNSCVVIKILRNRTDYHDLEKGVVNLTDLDVLFGNGLRNQTFIHYGNLPFRFASIISFNLDVSDVKEFYNQDMKYLGGSSLKGLDIDTTKDYITAIFNL